MNKRLMCSLAVVGLTAGCATVQIPPDRLEGTEASLRGAAELGAASVPAAKLHMQLATDQTEQARKMAADGDPRAVLVLERARADAELALGLAREVAVHGEAVRAAADLEAVRARTP